MGASSLPPGFRFHPTDAELVGYYLKRKVDGQKIELEVIPLIDLYKFDPWDLPEKSFLPGKDLEWFFFCPRDRKYPNGSRTNRATASGYWKATGKDRRISCDPSVTGLRKTLVFYRGRAPAGDRTDWVMHEYRLCEELPHGTTAFVGAFALCRVLKRSEQGQKMGETLSESKSKRTAFSATNNLSSGRMFGEVLGSHEINQEGSFSNSNNVSTPIASPSENKSGTESEPVVFDNDQIRGGGYGQHLLDASKDFPFEGDIQSNLILSTQFTDSLIGSSQYDPMGVSLMSPLPNTGFTNETYTIAGVGQTGCLTSCLNSSNFKGEGATGLASFDGISSASRNMSPSINGAGFEACNPFMSPPICRQSSGDGVWELSNFFWWPEESLSVG